MSAVTLASFGQRVMFYLAAAVSDFYIPRDNLSTHKLQSNQGPLVLNLQQTPKLLQPLVKEWSPRAFVVSFKLETDVNIISKKARESLSKNSHQVVISNILQTRRKTVVIVTASAENAIWMSDSELEKGKDIEEKIVADLVKKHNDFVTQNSLSDFNSGTDIVLDKNFPVSSTSGQVIYLSEGTHYQLQNRVGENSIGTSTVLLSQNETHQFTVPSSFTYKRPGGVLTSTASLHPDNSDVINYTSKFKFSNDNTALSEEMKEFIEMFKNKRMTLGYTQEDVGLELSGSSGPCYSQSFISRFESKQLAAKASEKMKPLLQAWLDAKDADQVTGVRLCKKRRRRTSFTSDSLAILIDHYKRNPKPNPSEISAIASQLNIEPVTVKVWFCNRKQSERRRSLGKSSGGETLKAELEANITTKGKIDPSTEQASSYSLGRLQPLISEQTPVTVLDATVVQFQPGATIATHEDTSTSRSYCATPVTVINTDPHIMQYSATAEGDSTTNTHSFTTPIAVMETEVPTSDRASSTTAVQ